MSLPSKVLVVDDEPLFQRLVQHHLERAGFVPLNARNGREAVTVAERESPRLIVMDVMMEDMDGMSALRLLKKNDRTACIPVIMVTASAYQITRMEAQASGASLFLTKPFSPAQLLLAIRKLLPETAPAESSRPEMPVAVEDEALASLPAGKA